MRRQRYKPLVISIGPGQHEKERKGTTKNLAHMKSDAARSIVEIDIKQGSTALQMSKLFIATSNEIDNFILRSHQQK